jgi:hypothetical protein
MFCIFWSEDKVRQSNAETLLAIATIFWVYCNKLNFFYNTDLMPYVYVCHLSAVLLLTEINFGSRFYGNDIRMCLQF